jgi:excisionase family DNA binding protein
MSDTAPPVIDLEPDWRDEARALARAEGTTVLELLHRRVWAVQAAGPSVPVLAGLESAVRDLASALRQQASGAPVWLDAPAAVKYARLPTVKSLYQFVRRGVVPAHRLGRRLRFSRDELDAVLRSGRLCSRTTEGR